MKKYLLPAFATHLQTLQKNKPNINEHINIKNSIAYNMDTIRYAHLYMYKIWLSLSWKAVLDHLMISQSSLPVFVLVQWRSPTQPTKALPCRENPAQKYDGAFGKGERYDGTI